jgi:hypothetical protein
VSASKRELKEETGLDIEITHICHIENFPRKGLQWTRFCVTGKISGGTLKTEKQKDEESIQANWFHSDKVLSHNKNLPLRSADFFALLESVRERVREIPPFKVITEEDLKTEESSFEYDIARVILVDTDYSGVFQFVDSGKLYRDATVKASLAESFAFAAQKSIFEDFGTDSIDMHSIHHSNRVTSQQSHTTQR